MVVLDSVDSLEMDWNNDTEDGANLSNEDTLEIIALNVNEVGIYLYRVESLDEY